MTWCTLYGLLLNTSPRWEDTVIFNFFWMRTFVLFIYLFLNHGTAAHRIRLGFSHLGWSAVHEPLTVGPYLSNNMDNWLMTVCTDLKEQTVHIISSSNAHFLGRTWINCLLLVWLLRFARCLDKLHLYLLYYALIILLQLRLSCWHFKITSWCSELV